MSNSEKILVDKNKLIDELSERFKVYYTSFNSPYECIKGGLKQGIKEDIEISIIKEGQYFCDLELQEIRDALLEKIDKLDNEKGEINDDELGKLNNLLVEIADNLEHFKR